ncbi:MAG TPA: response regulator transcription factor [Mucilaginibacter sp.]
MINIIVADNQPLTREGTMLLLANILDINIIGYSSSVTNLEQQLIQLHPQVVIIDPNINHHFTLKDIKKINSNFDFTRLLVLTNRQSKSKVLETVTLGIKNHLFKDCSHEELIHAIYNCAKGEQFFCKNTFETLFGNKLIAQQAEAIPTLSSRELELVHLIADGMTNKEIAERLFLSIHTVKTHRKNIIKKLGFTFKNTAEFSSFIQSKFLI